MKLLDGKTALIFGIANKRSIAWGIARAFHQQGAQQDSVMPVNPCLAGCGLWQNHWG